MHMKPHTTIIAVAFLAAGCATTGEWRFVHDTNDIRQTAADQSLCAAAWLATPMKAEIERQIAAEENGWLVWDLQRKRKRMANQHITVCMQALGYKQLWFDKHSPQGRTYKEKPKL